MAATHGHGNPKWTRDETILALDLYFDCGGRIPSSSDPRIQALSETLRAHPQHSRAARRESFRNADGVGFKLQNLRQVATGRGLRNVSQMDRTVWAEFGGRPGQTKEIADLIRAGIGIADAAEAEMSDEETFSEGRIVTEAHKRRERNRKLRKQLIRQRRQAGRLRCDVCECQPDPSPFGEAIFEAHHMVPLSAAGDRQTRLADMALVCANCHRKLHSAIAGERRWLEIDEAKQLLRV